MRFSKLAFVGRLVLLFLLGGHLLLRQVFAHLSLGDLVGHSTVLDSAYITELLLVLLLPVAGYVLFCRSGHQIEAAPGREEEARQIGISFYFAYALLGWGALQALLAIAVGPRQLPDLPPGFAAHPSPDWYLILRQSALSGYVIFFLYTVLFFRSRQRYIVQAVVCAVVISVGCAVADLFQLLGQPAVDSTLFGQETLAIAILGAIFAIIATDNLLVRGVALAILGLAGWRQSLRFQSGVAVSLAGALVLYFLLGLIVMVRGQSRTFYRALSCLVVIVILAGVVYFRAQSSAKMAEKLYSLSPRTYTNLLLNYDLGRPPANPKERMTSNREPFDPVADPEVYHLEAVYDTSNSVSVADNIWRILVWRRIAKEWYERNPIIGSGVGQPWFYEALYHTKFHYGEKREGLDPHNSYLNVLHRYGLVGFFILAGLLASVLITVVKALRTYRPLGDPLLEAIALYFFYTAVFTFFNNALEGPSYAMPFWFALGLMYARARQLLVKALPNDA